MRSAKWQMIKNECIQQFKTFQLWDTQKKYSLFHSSHYDWWTFPIDQPSSYGTKYQVGQEQKEKLQKDEQFIKGLRGNAILVSKAWGWDLINNCEVKERNIHQRWHQWPIRLYKMSRSLELFEQNDLHQNSVLYGLLLMQVQKFYWKSKDLEGYFNQWKDNKQQ